MLDTYLPRPLRMSWAASAPKNEGEWVKLLIVPGLIYLGTSRGPYDAMNVFSRDAKESIYSSWIIRRAHPHGAVVRTSIPVCVQVRLSSPS